MNLPSTAKIQCVAFIAASVDGFIAKLDGDIGWLEDKAYEIPQEDFGFASYFESVDALLMGRKTFQVVATFHEWPYANKPVYALSRSTLDIPQRLRGVVSAVSGELSDIVTDIAANGCKKLYVDGGLTIQSFLTADLLDEMVLTRIPILLGQGIPLFAEAIPLRRLKLLDAKHFSNGFVQSHYAIAHES